MGVFIVIGIEEEMKKEREWKERIEIIEGDEMKVKMKKKIEEREGIDIMERG